MGNGKCKHLNFIIRGSDEMGRAFCLDCEENPYLSECFQNLAEEMQKLIGRMREINAAMEKDN